MKIEIDIEQMDFLEAAIVEQLRKNGYTEEESLGHSRGTLTR